MVEQASKVQVDDVPQPMFQYILAGLLGERQTSIYGHCGVFVVSVPSSGSIGERRHLRLFTLPSPARFSTLERVYWGAAPPQTKSILAQKTS